MSEVHGSLHTGDLWTPELERTIMEVLSRVDDSESSFTHAAELFEGLTLCCVR
jgi:hypothetical protein